MLRAYFDESGIDSSSPVCVIGGLIGGVRQFVRLEKLWSEILQRYDLPCFHSKEAFASKDGIRMASPYREWEDRKFNHFLNEIATAVLSHQIHPVVVAVNKADFNSFNPAERQYLTGAMIVRHTGKFRNSGAPNQHYFVAFGLAIRYSINRAVKLHQKVDLIFDQQRQYEGWAKQSFAVLKRQSVFADCLGTLTYASKSAMVGLQIADLVAYLLRRYHTCEPDFSDFGEGRTRVMKRLAPMATSKSPTCGRVKIPQATVALDY